MSPLHVTMSTACTAYCFQEHSPDALYQPNELTYAHLIEVGSVWAQDYTYFLKQPNFKESILSFVWFFASLIFSFRPLCLQPREQGRQLKRIHWVSNIGTALKFLEGRKVSMQS